VSGRRATEARAPDLAAQPARRENLLFAEYPDLARAVPFLPLVHAPTPVMACPELEGYLGRGGVFIKRDDLVSPLYGGNKIRRFEYLFADAQRRGARHLVTAGGLASTQVTATIILGKALGFEVTAALFDQPITAYARRALITGEAAGGRLLHGGSYLGTALAGLGAYRANPSSYLILPGASNPMANLGYVEAMFELAEQVRQNQLPRPDLIVLPTGSGGTLAGLAVGAALLGWPTLVVGVRITELFACNRATIRLLIAATERYLQRHAGGAARRRGRAPQFELFHGAIGAGYGYPTPEAIEALPLIERLIGVPGEITYSAKALVGLHAMARRHPDKNILLWNTLSSARDPAPGAPSN